MKFSPIRLSAGLLSSLCLIATASCAFEKESPGPGLVRVSYAQTQCADRWGQARGTQQFVAAAQTYLFQQGLTLYKPQAIAKNLGFTCDACTCPTGLVLKGRVKPADLPAVLALGFVEQ